MIIFSAKRRSSSTVRALKLMRQSSTRILFPGCLCGKDDPAFSYFSVVTKKNKLNLSKYLGWTIIEENTPLEDIARQIVGAYEDLNLAIPAESLKDDAHLVVERVLEIVENSRSAWNKNS